MRLQNDIHDAEFVVVAPPSSTVSKTPSADARHSEAPHSKSEAEPDKAQLSVFASAAHSARTRHAGRKRFAVEIMAMALLGCALAAIAHQVINIEPQSPSVTLLAVDQALALEDISFETATDGPRPLLLVEAVIKNQSRKPMIVPPVYVRMNAQNSAVQTIARGEHLAGGESLRFSTRFLVSPGQTINPSLSFMR